jgi:phosphate/sulfate permease
MAVLLFIAACFLAYANGANDNFKGVASLFGSRTTSYRTRSDGRPSPRSVAPSAQYS